MRQQFNVTRRGLTFSRTLTNTPNTRRFETSDELETALHESGFEACELIVGIDFTKSNYWTGKKSFEGRCLHDLNVESNPYSEALRLIATNLRCLDDDHKIPCYGFGDVNTGRTSVFSFNSNNDPVMGLERLVERYKQIVPAVNMSGPTTFAPLIRQAMKDVYNADMKFHVLLILADGQVSEECLEDTKEAIVQASAFPISIVIVGIGDGPWEEMERFDDEVLPNRAWDNFQFFEFNKIATNSTNVQGDGQQDQIQERAMEEIPEQFRKARNLVGKTDEAWCIVNTLPRGLVIDPPVRSS